MSLADLGIVTAVQPALIVRTCNKINNIYYNFPAHDLVSRFACAR